MKHSSLFNNYKMSLCGECYKCPENLVGAVAVIGPKYTNSRSKCPASLIESVAGNLTEKKIRNQETREEFQKL